jgi:hypothetical protein
VRCPRWRPRSAERLAPTDRREIGNVVWIELDLWGYRDKRLGVQYGLYRPRAGGALVPGTAREIALPPERQDVETSFLPVWVGYPRQGPFQAQFRLIEAGQVRRWRRPGACADRSRATSARPEPERPVGYRWCARS